MTIAMSELRQLVADSFDPSQPLRVVALNVGKKASRHSTVRADEDHPVRLTVKRGKYDERSYIELAHYPEFEPLMPETLLAALDELLEEEPKATLGWVYFFYFPIDYFTFFKKKVRMDCSLLDTSKVRAVYPSSDEPNTLVIEAEYDVGSFE